MEYSGATLSNQLINWLRALSLSKKHSSNTYTLNLKHMFFWHKERKKKTFDFISFHCEMTAPWIDQEKRDTTT